MASKSYKARKFQIFFLEFLDKNPNREVHIYTEVMNYWSNDLTHISLPELKEAINMLCERHFIISKNNGHHCIGTHGIPEAEQKKNALCVIQDAGRKFLRGIRLRRRIKMGLLALLSVMAIYGLWQYVNSTLLAHE